MRSRRYALVLSLVMSIVTNAKPLSPPEGFRNFRWGAPPTKELKKFSGPTFDGLTMYVPVVSSIPPLYDLPVAEEAYSFSKGRFYSASSWLDGAGNFEKMKSTLTRKFGPPTFTNEQLRLWKWKWPGTKIEVHLSYQARFARTTVMFLNNAI